jgi:hypothetical protein
MIEPFPINYLDLRMKNECFLGRRGSSKLLSLVDMIKSISAISHLIQDSCENVRIKNKFF